MLVLFAGFLAGFDPCNCQSGPGRGQSLTVRLLQPHEGPVQGFASVEVEVSPASAARLVQVFVLDQGGNLLLPQSRPDAGDDTDSPSPRHLEKMQIAEMVAAPYRFRWNTHLLPDGFHLLQAVATHSNGEEHHSPKVLVQIVNEPPRLWFVNCHDGQFIRGVFPLLVSLQRLERALKAPPILLLNQQQGPPTTDPSPPYRFLIPTQKYGEGEQLELLVEGEDLDGHTKQIICRPRVDNSPPQVSFLSPATEGEVVPLAFTVRFQASDRFGVREVRLWIDGNPCRLAQKSPGDSSCLQKKNRLVGSQSPHYPIEVTLSEKYQAGQPILLSARAVDLAGNLSDPAAERLVTVDPQRPEIFIHSPGLYQVVNEQATFQARVIDNRVVQKVEFLLRDEGGKERSFLQQRIGRSSVQLKKMVQQIEKTFGYGRKTFVVRAWDISGNKAQAERLFLIGCGDTTDCPAGKVCHQHRCLTPAGINKPCDANTPCQVVADCVQGHTPVCANSRQKYCRLRCNPGNQFVSADECQKGYYCSSTHRVCLPGDGCAPLSQDCGKNKQCVPKDNDSGYCVPLGRVPPGSSCQMNCSAQGNCTRGYWCVFLVNVGRSACLKVCDTQNPSCPSGSCRALSWVFGGKPLRYGTCQ